jgi:hypothetical protein
MKPELDFTTQIGCKVNCLKYCPQELITSRYTGERTLSFEMFKRFMEGVPKDHLIGFAGFSEPFLNQECPDMIVWAHEQGYKIVIYTTLVGLTPENARRILRIPFELFTLHLPDALGNAHIAITPEYQTVLCEALTTVPEIKFMNMGSDFRTNNSENMPRGRIPPKTNRRVFCPYLDTPDYQVMPNGEVFFCCMTRGLEGYVGSLKENTYWHLANPDRFKQESVKMQTDPSSLCHKCPYSYPYVFRYLKRLKSKYFGDGELVFEILKRKAGIA